MASTILDLLHQLRAGNSASPRLTWYGPDGERVELSGRVLDNWVAKTSNFLTEELDAERGTRVRIDLPGHWKSAVLALAAWQAGAVVVDDGDADLVFTAAPDAGAGAGTQAQTPAGTGTQVAVALPALAMSFPGPLPAGTLDYAALVRQFADSYEPFDPPLGSDEALRTAGSSYTQSALMSGFASGAPARARVLVGADGSLPQVLAGLLGAWAADGSAVLVHPAVEVTDHLLATEQVTGADAGAHPDAG
ncbi:TIGR03089 family protein [Sinomonas halotolerans]|uniref:TIGR03089 family protein n=1 Tax=Sinomonas halotolerans TaxID=1644133 RepID=A0ABU9WUZ4_9MICC